MQACRISSNPLITKISLINDMRRKSEDDFGIIINNETDEIFADKDRCLISKRVENFWFLYFVYLFIYCFFFWAST